MAGLAILGYVQKAIPHISEEELIHLDLGDDISDDGKLDTINIVSIGFKYIWERRLEKKRIELYAIRAEIEASIELLRKTRFAVVGEYMITLIN